MLIEFKLKGIGWIEILLDINNKKHSADASYLTEPLFDLVEGIISMIPGYTPKDELKKIVTIELELEPITEKWSLRLDNSNKLLVEVEWIDVDKKEVIFKEICEFDLFIKDLVKSLENLLKEHGIIGYKNTWYNGDFPLSGFLKLKNYIDNVQLSLENDENSIGIPMYKSDLRKEIDILSSLLI